MAAVLDKMPFTPPADSWMSSIMPRKEDTYVTMRLKNEILRRQPKTFEDAIDIVFAVQKEVMIMRQRKYGKGNIKQDGVYGCVIRDGDKDMRKREYYKKRMSGKPMADTDPEDSLDDSFVDGGNYNLIALIYAYGMWDLPLAEDATDRPQPPQT